MRAAILVLALLSPQGDETVRALLQALDEDAIDAREDAAGALVKLGKAVVPQLEAARRRAGPDLAQRIGEVVRRIHELDRLAAILPPPTLVTIRGQGLPLSRVAEELRKQAPTPIEWPAPLPPGAVTLDLDRVPFWPALEEICRASGGLMIEAAADKVTLKAEPYVAVPRLYSGRFAVWLQQIECTRGVTLATPVSGNETFMVQYRVAWEKGTRPDAVQIGLEELVDGAGANLKENDQDIVQPEVEVPPGSILVEGYAAAARTPPRGVTSLSKLTARIDARFTLQYSGVTFEAPDRKFPADSACSRFSARLLRCLRVAGEIRADIQVVPDPKGREAFSPPLFKLRDAAGNEHGSSLTHATSDDRGLVYTYSFPLPEGAAVKEIYARTPEVTHTESLKFELKDVSLR